MKKNSNLFLRIFLFLVVFYLLVNTFFEYFVNQNTGDVVENIRALYILDFWNYINIGFLNSKFFFSFVLMFPLIVSLGYLLVYISLKFFGSLY